jgi:hypothetical protein
MKLIKVRVEELNDGDTIADIVDTWNGGIEYRYSIVKNYKGKRTHRGEVCTTSGVTVPPTDGGFFLKVIKEQ